MKKLLITISIFFFIGVSAGITHAGLNDFLSNLNIQANANINDFGVKLSAQFGVPLKQVRVIIKTVELPADAFMCLQLCRMTNKQPERVVQTYKSNKSKGWGVIAKQLGIKPGSAEFQALKLGNFAFTGEPGGNNKKAQGKGKGKDRKK